MVVADGGGYGAENTWPGLDSWQMAGAYLLVGRQRVALDYFDFVQASQRKDGNIPFAIFPGEQSPGSTDSWLRGLQFPEDVYRCGRISRNIRTCASANGSASSPIGK